MSIDTMAFYSFEMLWMETFCFYCSVRLGVILSASFSILQALVIILILSIYGTSLFTSTKHFIEKNEQQNQDALFLKVIDEITGHPLAYTVLFDVFCGVHALSSGLAIYAAFKVCYRSQWPQALLQKMFLIPYICSQLIHFLALLAAHVITMIVFKKIVNLGILIGMTLAGGFYILFEGYSWTGAVGLYQIITLVNSQKYKVLYGEDPLTPRERINILRRQQELNENVKIVNTNYNKNYYYNRQPAGFKRKVLIEEHPQWQYGGGIISVIPVDQQDNDDVELIHFNNWHWNELVGVKKSFK